MRFSTSLLLLAASAFVWVLQGYRPDGRYHPSMNGVVMGEDYRTLLSNPTLTLDTEQGPGKVYFVWTSDNPARLAEVLRMGAHMQTMKKQLEAETEGFREDDQPIRTARNEGN